MMKHCRMDAGDRHDALPGSRRRAEDVAALSVHKLRRMSIALARRFCLARHWTMKTGRGVALCWMSTGV